MRKLYYGLGLDEMHNNSILNAIFYPFYIHLNSRQDGTDGHLAKRGRYYFIKTERGAFR